MTTIIVHGPEASGKTRNAHSLAARLGCERVVDNWTPLRRLTPGALHLTIVSPHCIRPRVLAGVDRVLSIEDALQLISVPPPAVIAPHEVPY